MCFKYFFLLGVASDVDILENIIDSLPIKSENLLSLIQVCITNLKMDQILVLIILLRKLCQTDKWALAKLDKTVANSLAEIVEKVLVDSQSSQSLFKKVLNVIKTGEVSGPFSLSPGRQSPHFFAESNLNFQFWLVLPFTYF